MRTGVEAKRAASWDVVLLRVAGWLLLVAGVAYSGVLAWELFGTGQETQAAQRRLLETWSDPGPEGLLAGEEDAAAVGAPMAALDPGDAVAMLEFSRPGAEPPMDSPLAVVEGVRAADLRHGPGHYPGTALPGELGNFAVAGHRTTYGAPFAHLDRLRPGDEVQVSDGARRRHRYRVVEQQIVQADEVWVTGSDPLGTGRPMLTLTTCHPRFSNRQRLVVFAELVAESPR